MDLKRKETKKHKTQKKKKQEKNTDRVYQLEKGLVWLALSAERRAPSAGSVQLGSGGLRFTQKGRGSSNSPWLTSPKKSQFINEAPFGMELF